MPLVVSDQQGLDHVVVYANGQKVAWAGAAGGDRIDHKVRVDLRPGVNRIVTIAEDAHGLRSRSVVHVRGVIADSVDAGE